MKMLRGMLRLLIWLTAGLGWLVNSEHLPCSGPLCRREDKRDIFMSRGWGAGGMPFTLFYPGAPRQEPLPLEESLPQLRQDPLHQPQVEYLTSSGHHQEQDQSKQGIIPQLFVSYGWGPLGKK